MRNLDTNRVGYRLGYETGTESDTGPLTDSVSKPEPTRVPGRVPTRLTYARSRPVLSCPVPSCPDPWAIPPLKERTFQNGNTFLVCRESEVEGSAPVTGQAKERAMNYPTSVMSRAKELTDAGFCPTDVGRIIEREIGEKVSRFTIRRWTDETVAELKRAEDRRRNCLRRAAARDGRLGSERHSVILQERRVRSLAATGMPLASVARVMEFDYPGAGWSYGRVRDMLPSKRARLEIAA